jgi:23S rRNA pseudouridine1911/1915/1917 synthase
MTSDRARLLVEADQGGLRIDQYLRDSLPGRSRAAIQRLIKDGHVTRENRQVRQSDHVREGDTILVEIPAPVPAAPEPEDLPLEIVHEDHDLIVVNKAAGQVVHPAAGHAAGTLVNALLHHVRDLSGIGGERRPGIVHRLDRGTSGLMVVAKHDEAHAELARQFHEREVEKEYVALVWGDVRAGLRIDDPIGRDAVNRKRMSTRARRARTAVTRVTRAEHLDGVTLLRVAISTGRTHQIRVHLSAIGHPVVGDPVYGGMRRRVPPHLKAVAGLARPFLHAATLAFAHPRDEARMRFDCPLPPDLESVIGGLRRARVRRRTPDRLEQDDVP